MTTAIIVQNQFLEAGDQFHAALCIHLLFTSLTTFTSSCLFAAHLYSSAIQSERKTTINMSQSIIKPERDAGSIINTLSRTRRFWEFFWTGRGSSTTVHWIWDEVRDKQRQRCLCFWTRSDHRQRCLWRWRGFWLMGTLAKWTMETGFGFNDNGAYGLDIRRRRRGTTYHRGSTTTVHLDWRQRGTIIYQQSKAKNGAHCQFYSHLQLVCRTQFLFNLHRILHRRNWKHYGLDPLESNQ